MVKNFRAGSKWLPGVISKRTEPVLFVVQMCDGCERRCHQDQWHIFIILIVSCTNLIVAPGNLKFIPSEGMQVYNVP